MPTDRRTLLALAATALLLTLCLTPKSMVPRREESPPGIPHLDKVVHFGMFAGFGLLWACAGRSAMPTRSRAAGVLAAAFALAIGTELAQGLPQVDRDPDTLDALADAAGAIAGVGLVAAWGAIGQQRVDRDGAPKGEGRWVG
jgi:VanZ family protein